MRDAIGAFALLVLGFLIGLLVKGCGGEGGPRQRPDTLIQRDTIRTTIKDSFQAKQPEPDTAYLIDTFRQRDTVTDHDTAYIVLDYYRYRGYNKTFTDSNISIHAQIGVQNNELERFSLNYELNQTTNVARTLFIQE